MSKKRSINNGNKRILEIAIPSIISNITVPLLGLIDVTIVGHLGAPAYIGAIAVGGLLFNIIYWIFGFLRMGTSGMTSQAYGKRDLDEVTRLLLRSVGVGLFIAFCLLLLQYPIQKTAFTFIKTSREVQELATLYFRICIWGAPAMLGLYGFAGWFIGMQNSRFPMYIAITQNIVNIAASLSFVYLLKMKVEGVALGTLIAQYDYSATPESDVPLQPKGFLLLDSGAQYLDGTTDITRTIALGELTEEEKTDYTLILKGHIALAMAKFPVGTRGAQLDVLARMPIWKYGMNFLHGTGHGVGHFLSVHEGPQSIRMNENPVVLQPGMVTSNEPGVYKAGSHGIRTENLTLVCKDKEGMFGDYLKFETITLCPICKKGIVKEMLTNEEIEWLNNYHQIVYEKLSPNLNEEEKVWLQEATASI